MRYIPTSAVVVEKLKQAAKQAKRKYKIPHSDALNRVARGEGYDHWHHVTLCARETERQAALPSLVGECHRVVEAALEGRSICIITGPEILPDGPLILFSTTDGDAWLLEPNEEVCICLAWHGTKGEFGVNDAGQHLLIDWDGSYELCGNFFCVNMDNEEIGVRMIGGYPIEELRQAINKSLSFESKMNDIFGGRGGVNLTDDVIADLVRQGWSHEELVRARRDGAIYSPARDSLLYPAISSLD
ncbi:hypothetical protein [Ralstonia solanacearum]|uniref:hypothetical protein n=1 Tax=Ralstonia solanacearum TaxID=305 RepID=UPI000E575FED|nr:hypothetical protein [Ralstonia solanacearum]AXW24570.1 hypothetical protein CJO86_13885 [Ralstonia solanacearum]